MNGPAFAHPGEIGLTAFVLLAGVAVIAGLRLAGIMMGSRLSASHPLFEWARAVAAAVIAAQVALLVGHPMGSVGVLPLGVRLGAVVAGFLAYHFTGRSVLAGVAVGDAVILAALAAGV